MKMRDLVIFVAGAEFFHTLTHFFMPYFVELPLKTSYVLFTTELNLYAIVFNAVITVVLLWWASKLKK